MSQNASINAVTDRPSSRRLQGIALCLLSVVVAQYLAGYLLLLVLHLDLRAASPLTLIRYLYYFRNSPLLSGWIHLCLAASVLIVLATVAATHWPRSRSLHGEARFASP